MRFKVYALILLFNFAQAQYKIAFIPFDNFSNYKGRWNLDVEIPRYLGDFVFKFYGVEVLPIDSVLKVKSETGLNFRDAFLFSELEKRFAVKYIIGGKILTFKITRFATGFPLIAGYESYNAEVEIEVMIFNPLTGEMSSVFGASGEVKKRGLGLTLLGKPTEEYSEFYSLDLLKFGSYDFNETIVGEAMKKAGMEFALRLKKYIPKIFENLKEVQIETAGETELKAVMIEGSVLYVRPNNAVYVSLGNKDGLVSGMAIYVFEDSEKIGELEVVDVIDEHFSLCKVVKSSKEIKKGDKVKAKVVK